MSSLKYYTIDFEITSELASDLEKIKHDGIEEYAIDEAQVDELLGEKAFSGGDVDETTINNLESLLNNNQRRLYFYGENAKLRAQKAASVFAQSGQTVYLEEHDEQDWNESWRQGYTTVKVSDHLWVIPSWEKESSQVPSAVTPVYLYPGQGFGTGRHETTALCLELFETASFSRASVLDFGCGSGILGIAAQKKYKCDVTYVDIDQSALENTKQNLLENELDVSASKILLRNHYQTKEYDLVFANILLDILIKEKETLTNSVRTGGSLIVSGLLNEHVAAFRDEYQLMFHEVKCVSRGDWSALMLVKK